jgi:hypothetical protein
MATSAIAAGQSDGTSSPRKSSISGRKPNKWDEKYFIGEVDDAEIEYGVEQSDAIFDIKIRELYTKIRQRAAAARLGISRMALCCALKCSSGFSWAIRW